MNDTTKILAAFGAGAVVGAIAGVLFAPDKGAETRIKITEQGKKLAGSIKDKIIAGTEKFNDLKEGLRQNFSEEVGEV